MLKPNVEGHEAHGDGDPCGFDCVHCHVLVFKRLKGFSWWDCRLCSFRRWITGNA